MKKDKEDELLRTRTVVVDSTREMDEFFNEATKVYDYALYYYRREYFGRVYGEIETPNYGIYLYGLFNEVHPWFKELKLSKRIVSYVFRSVQKNWKSFMKATKEYYKCPSKFLGKPKPPTFLKNSGRFSSIYVEKKYMKELDNESRTFKFPKTETVFKFPKGVDIEKVKGVRFTKYYGKVKMLCNYEVEKSEVNRLDQDSWLGIDLGVRNLVSMTTFGCENERSVIFKGGDVKSTNQFFNKERAECTSILETVNNRKSSKKLERLAAKRDQKISYDMHCISRKIIDFCIENHIGNIAVGKNDGWKQEVNNGRKQNQKFTNIPHAKLINMLEYKGELAGINVYTTEESYTSKTDHLVGEKLRKYGVSERGEKLLGVRNRGLFTSSCGRKINSDINGAIGMLRKVGAIEDSKIVEVLESRKDFESPEVMEYK